MWQNPKKHLTEVNKDRDVQYSVGVEIAQTNRPKYQQISQKRMNREPQSTPEIIFKDYNFIGVRHWKGLTTGWPPSGGDAVRKHARSHHSFELRFSSAQWRPLFIMTSSASCLLWACFLRVHGSPLWRHHSDLDAVWRRQHVWLRIWKCGG